MCGVQRPGQRHAPHVPHGQKEKGQGEEHDPDHVALLPGQGGQHAVFLVVHLFRAERLHGEAGVLDGFAQGAQGQPGRIEYKPALTRAQIDDSLAHALHPRGQSLDPALRLFS